MEKKEVMTAKQMAVFVHSIIKSGDVLEGYFFDMQMKTPGDDFPKDDKEFTMKCFQELMKLVFNNYEAISGIVEFLSDVTEEIGNGSNLDS
jgi:hypothetical protein